LLEIYEKKERKERKKKKQLLSYFEQKKKKKNGLKEMILSIKNLCSITDCSWTWCH